MKRPVIGSQSQGETEMTAHIKNNLEDQITGAGLDPNLYDLAAIAAEVIANPPASMSDLWIAIDEHRLPEYAVYNGLGNYAGSVPADCEMAALAQFPYSDDTWKALPARPLSHKEVDGHCDIDWGQLKEEELRFT
jgi:hypothetical protein